jgi:predicted lipid-binding transport protein (Tim44 family)
VLPVPTNATTPLATTPSGPLTRRQVRLILTGLLIGLFLGALDQTIGGGFRAAALVLVLGLGTALRMRELPLRTQSAFDALRTQSASDAQRADATRSAGDGAAGEHRSAGR